MLATGGPPSRAEATTYLTTCAIAPTSTKTYEVKLYLEKRLEMENECDAVSDALQADIRRTIP